MQTKTKSLTESAMLISVAIVLELVSKMFIPEMPFGGQVTHISHFIRFIIFWEW